MRYCSRTRMVKLPTAIAVFVGVVMWWTTNSFLFSSNLDNVIDVNIENAQNAESQKPRRVKPADIVHIVLTCDAKHIVGTIGVINSSIHNTQSPERLKFHIVAQRDNLMDLNKMIHSAFDANPVSFHLHVNDDNKVAANVHDTSRADLSSSIVYSRFFFATLFPDFHKVIYVDVDLVVLGDLALLWELPIDGFPVAAVQRCRTRFKRQFFYTETNAKTLAKFKEKECVFNNGVMVYDLDAWRKYADQNPKNTYQMQLLKWTLLNNDQPLYALGSQPPFNLVFYRNYFKLDPSWNVMDAGEAVIHPTIAEVRTANILHWNGIQKPWDLTTRVLNSGYFSRYVVDYARLSKTDPFTLVIVTMGTRERALIDVIEHVSRSGEMAEAILVWNNIETSCPASILKHFTQRRISVTCLKQTKNEMQNRLTIASSISTEAVLHHDDDAMIRQEDMLLGLRVWQHNRDMIVGFQPRVIRQRKWDKQWEYGFHLTEGHYSIVIGKFFFISKTLMLEYSNNEKMVAINTGKFCEDISINFVAAQHGGVMVVESDHWELPKPKDEGLSQRIDTLTWKKYRADCIPMLETYLESISSPIRLESFPRQTKIAIAMDLKYNQVVYRNVIPTESICSNVDGIKPCRMPNCTEAHGFPPCWGPNKNENEQ